MARRVCVRDWRRVIPGIRTPRTPPRHHLTTPRSVYRLGPVRPRSFLSVSKYGELKRASRRHGGVDLDALGQAYEVLSDVSKRSEYDESIGLAEKRRSRIDLRPLGFFSKSLSQAQQSWPTWGRELLSVLLTLMHFRIIVTGMVVVIHTDHLNNTVLGENLTSPDKIMRMLLKIEGLVEPQWKFSPGNTQIGDGFSRNPEGRDEVRGESQGKAHMPPTLAEAFAASMGMTLEGNLLTDDAEAFAQHFRNRIMRPRIDRTERTLS